SWMTHNRRYRMFGAVYFILHGGHIMSINELEAKVRELREIQTRIEEALEEAEAIKDAIQAAMGDAEELRAGEYRVTWEAVKSSRLDAAALEKAAPEVAEGFTRTTPTRRFCVA